MNIFSASTSVTFRQRLIQSYILLTSLTLLLGGLAGAIGITLQTAKFDPLLLLLLAVLLLTCFALVGLFGAYISRQLIEPMIAIATRAKKIADGDDDTPMTISSEIIELQTLVCSFNAMAQKIQQAKDSQQEFMANVHHDLHSLLISIQGFNQTFIDSAVPPEHTSHFSEIIYSEASHLSLMLQNLVELSQSRAGDFSITARDINLKDILEQSSQKFKELADQVGIKFECDLPHHPLPVSGDAERLEQVINNLVENTLIYAQDGGRHVKLVGKLGGIQRSSAANGHLAHQKELHQQLGRWWVEIKVEDNAPSIQDQQQELNFQPFYATYHASRDKGLAFAIAREIVEAHGGHIHVKNQNGTVKGSQFVIRLPMRIN